MVIGLVIFIFTIFHTEIKEIRQEISRLRQVEVAKLKNELDFTKVSVNENTAQVTIHQSEINSNGNIIRDFRAEHDKEIEALNDQVATIESRFFTYTAGVVSKKGPEGYEPPQVYGNPIELCQEALKKLRYNLKSVDGVFGKNTAKALKNFQKNVGIKPTGVVDTITLLVLKESLRRDCPNERMLISKIEYLLLKP